MQLLIFISVISVTCHCTLVFHAIVCLQRVGDSIGRYCSGGEQVPNSAGCTLLVMWPRRKTPRDNVICASPWHIEASVGALGNRPGHFKAPYSATERIMMRTFHMRTAGIRLSENTPVTSLHRSHVAFTLHVPCDKHHRRSADRILK